MKKIISYIILMISALAAHSQIDPLEYPPGAPNYSNVAPAIDQIKGFPVPRYKAGNKLIPNVPWMDYSYFSGYKQAGATEQSTGEMSKLIQTEVCKNYNYHVALQWGCFFLNTYSLQVANANPLFKTCIVTLRAQSKGCGNSSCMWCGCLASDHYFQDSNGQFRGWSGEVTGNKSTPRPTSPPQDWANDGNNAKSWVECSLNGLNRNVDLLNEDGEVYPIIEPQACDIDPVVKAERATSGLSAYDFLAKKVTGFDNAYRDKIMSLSKTSGAKYTEYRLDGHRTYQLSWKESRLMQTPINGQYYSTGDLYIRWPNNWQNWVSAWHGRKWFSQSRHYEIALGDKLFSPFVGAGWATNEEENVRPAQWLGMLKQMGIMGAEFYYTGYFNETFSPPNNPKGYAWQIVMPSYSQAITSHYEDILRGGDLMAGDMTDNTNVNELGVNTPIPLYQFYTGKNNYVVAARKMGTKYVISGTIQNSSNQIGSAPLTDVSTITLDGQQMTFKIRRQGSTYIYDSNAKVFYQLDGWHQYEHPSRWTTDIEIEAEVNDATTGTLKSTFAPPDFVNFKTVLVLTNGKTANYSMTTRAATSTLFVKLSGTGTLNTNFDGTPKNIQAVGEGWYKLDMGSVAAGSHTLSFTSMSNLEIDSISLTSNPNKYPTVIIPPVECPIPQWVSAPVTNITTSSCLVWFKLVPEATVGYTFYIKDRVTGAVKTQQKNTNTAWDSRKNITGLKSLTTYDITMVSKCAGGVLSQPSAAISVTTK